MLVRPRAHLPPPADGWIDRLRKNTMPMLCLLCDSVTRETDTLVVLQSQLDRNEFATAWLCERCSEMDDGALLDFAEERFRAAMQYGLNAKCCAADREKP